MADGVDSGKYSPGEGWVPVNDDGFIGHVGPIYAKAVEDGPELIGFLAEDIHRNLNGVVQGGMLMTLADRGMGRIARKANGDGPVATVHFSYDFLGAGKLGTFIALHPVLIKETRSLIFMEGSVISEGDVIGRANGVWKKLAMK